MTYCTFINNTAGTNGGAIYWGANNGNLTDSNFTNNKATQNGGAVYWNGADGSIINSNFANNIAVNAGGGVYWTGNDGNLINSTFIANAANNNAGGGVYWIGNDGNLTSSIFNGNDGTIGDGGAVHWWGSNGTLINSTFIANTASRNGGAVYWNDYNSNMSNCNFTNNHANQGDNVYWRWTVNGFLNKYNQIHDYDYVLILNGVGTPTNTIVLNKKGITISSQWDATFDAKGENVHFEITGSDVTIEKLTFRNFNFTGIGGAISWTGIYGTLKNCNFIKILLVNGVVR